jgi:Sulfotransferase domain
MRKLVPSERLLTYELGSGWEPLCKFLGRDVPNVPFPHLNESKEFEIWMRNKQIRHFNKGLAGLLKLAGAGFIAVIAYWIYKG